MTPDYITDLNNWIHYVNNWMLFWNRVDLICFGVILGWMIYLTIKIH